MNNEEFFMREALKQAKKAFAKNEVPVGCVIVFNDKIIARGYNKRETLQQSLAHAEIIAIKKACKALKTWRLEQCDMYITLEPCIMCSGAIIQSRIRKVIYGAYDYRYGAHKSFISIFDKKFNHSVDISGGYLASDCENLIKNFFKKLRIEKKS